MKILFLTTYNVTLAREHFFTINVWKSLANYHTLRDKQNSDELILGTVVIDNIEKSFVEQTNANDHNYYLLHLSCNIDHNNIVEEIKNFFIQLKVDIVHSNMIEGYDVEAAKLLQIPIYLTIHIGGFICPRGGGDGFLRYDNTICNQPVGKECTHCCSCNIPFPRIAYFLAKMIPNAIAHEILSKMKRHIFYITPLLLTKEYVNICQKRIELFKYATIFAANEKLGNLLAINGLRKNVILLPHGVKERERLPFPDTQEKVKFFFLARIQYSKGLHVLLRALEGIDNNKYELHVIGDAEKARSQMRYDQSIRVQARGKNVFFHGRLPNNEIERVIKDMHVMIHPAIFLEVYGISIAEALSMGRPVIATKCGGAEMQVIDGHNGWLVEPNNEEELRRAINKVIDMKDRLESFSSRCHLPHPIDDYAKKLWSIYHRNR